ncbi:LysR family transcriptional regulator [Nitratireductor sp. GCM10026969]|uniref:LysR family transcriptional regulator n=1 Tax=Nitratireductor sp. GCM10026969 TaxID=3252645 RepID=UPI003616C903
MQFSLRTLKYIVAIADTGAMTEAARQLNISQPSISSALNAAEEALGIQLFVRHHARGVTPTVAGRRFVNEARLLLKQARDFERSIDSLGASMTGEITVGAFVTLATRYMPGLLSEFATRMPGITVRLKEGNQQEVVEDLLTGRTELALAYAYALPSEIEGERLIDLPPYLLLSADHPAASKPAVSLKEVAGEPFILLDLPHSRDYFMNLFMTCGVLPKIIYRSQSYELIRGLVGRSCGYTIHNALPGTSLTYDGSFVTARPIVEKLPAVQVMCLHLGRSRMRPAVQTFAHFLEEAFAPGGMFHSDTHLMSLDAKARRAEAAY